MKDTNIWEEKNLTDHNPILTKKEENVNSIITTETKNDLMPKDLDCITRKKKYDREWIKNNRDKVNASQRKYWHKNKEKILEKQKNKLNGYKTKRENEKFFTSLALNARKRHLKRYYGLTVEEYDALLIKQNDCCAICNRHKSLFKTRFHVDNNHLTGKVRELLCGQCNNALGNLRESIELFDKAKEYLIKHSRTSS